MKTREIWQSFCDKWNIRFEDIEKVEWIDSAKFGVEYNKLMEFTTDEGLYRRHQSASIEQLIAMANTVSGEIVSIDKENMVVDTTDFRISYSDRWHIRTIPTSEVAKERMAKVDWQKVNAIINEDCIDDPIERKEPIYKGDEYTE